MTKKDQKVVEQETAKEDIDTLKEDTVVEVKESKVRKAITYGLIGLATIASVVMGVFGIRVIGRHLNEDDDEETSETEEKAE